MCLFKFLFVIITMFCVAGGQHKYYHSPPYYSLDDKVSVESVNFVVEEEGAKIQEIQNRYARAVVFLVFSKSDGSDTDKIVLNPGRKVYVKLSCFEKSVERYMTTHEGVMIEKPPRIAFYSQVIRAAQRRYNYLSNRDRRGNPESMYASFKTGVPWIETRFVFK
ncbi:MAG: hypothetical protein OQK82_08115 [Candidatus Pacearchaeota archaeon]|nr:hypothetical protein [Candidatus Pacearchaeota archaeon]